MTGVEHSVGFKVSTSGEQIGDPLDKYNNNYDISIRLAIF